MIKLFSETEKPEKGDSVHNTLAVNDTVREIVTFSESGTRYRYG
jgi:hypothetical protein